MLKIYHNPRCSKSRQTLALIQDSGREVEIVEYLKTPPTQQQLQSLLKKLKLSARDLLRAGEAEYTEAGLADTSLSEAQIIEKMVEFPKLIERPIVCTDTEAVIGRPPERVLDLLNG